MADTFVCSKSELISMRKLKQTQKKRLLFACLERFQGIYEFLFPELALFPTGFLLLLIL